MATAIATYGSWRSPITSEVVIEESITLMEVKIDPFQEGRPFSPSNFPSFRKEPIQDGAYDTCFSRSSYKVNLYNLKYLRFANDTLDQLCGI